jgi:hypothetical protein
LTLWLLYLNEGKYILFFSLVCLILLIVTFFAKTSPKAQPSIILSQNASMFNKKIHSEG